MILANFFSSNVLDRVFCIELEEYRPFELVSIIFQSKRQVRSKDVFLHNFRTTVPIQFILIPLEQE